jgi:ribose transport system substrate-binding protein
MLFSVDTGRRRGLATALAILVAAVGLAACGDDDDSDGGGGGDEAVNIAFFGFAKANSFAQATWSGIQDAARAEGAKATFFDPNFDSQEQVSQIQNATVSGEFDAFIVQANDGNAVVPAIQDAIDNDITVVAEFTPVGAKYDTLEPQVDGMIFVGEPTVENGETLGRMGVDACEGIDTCRVAYLEGFKALPLDNARTDAVHEQLEAAPNVELVTSVEGGYTQESGLKAAQNVLQAHPDVDVIIGSAQAIQGTEQALGDVGKKPGLGRDEVKLIGNGGSVQAVEGVNDDRWFAAYVIAERDAGKKAAEIAIAAVRGEDVPQSFDTRKLQEPYGTKQSLRGYEGQYRD